MASLLVISSAPALIVNGQPFLDIKFVEGMRLYSKLWDGPVSCILHQREGQFPFGRIYDPETLPFDIRLLPTHASITVKEINGHDIILCGGDSHEYLHLAEACRVAGKKLVYIIEYIPETRRQIVFLETEKSLPRKLYSLLFVSRQEVRRRRAFRIADGVQANGYPAFTLYSQVNENTMMYLDNRIGVDLLAREHEMENRAQRLLRGEPLRLMYSGRLENLKGSQDLVPIAKQLAAKGIEFTLDIFGAGSLEEEIRRGIVECGLQGKVRLNGAVDFETELVPFARENADIYLSCHRQSDPSCTYLENMGCGLAVIGYANRMWSALCEASEAGWVAPLGHRQALADAVADASIHRDKLVTACNAALRFAGRHPFEAEFQSRIDHLRAIAEK